MNAALFQDHSATSTLTLTSEEAEALAFLLPLSSDYPDIDRWYCEKVVPGLRTGSRKLVRIVREDTLVGLGIGKIEPQERKICTVRVAPSHAGTGIGVRIFDHLLRWLDVDQPHLTISDTKLPLFERIFDYFGFANTSAQPGYYRHQDDLLDCLMTQDVFDAVPEVLPPTECLHIDPGFVAEAREPRGEPSREPVVLRICVRDQDGGSRYRGCWRVDDDKVSCGWVRGLQASMRNVEGKCSPAVRWPPLVSLGPRRCRAPSLA